MILIALGNNQSLGIEKYGNRVRLILVQHAKEMACRKESIKTIQNFLASEDSNLFKGRIQLKKCTNNILVFFKNQQWGEISVELLRQKLMEL